MRNIFSRNKLGAAHGRIESDEECARYKGWVADESMRHGVGNEYPTLTETQVITITERLIRVARDKVYIFGNLLPEEVFLSDRVLIAMGRFHTGSPKGQVIVLTNDSTYSREGFASLSGYGVDVDRVSVIPIPEHLCSAYQYRFVLSDSPEAYSFWLDRFSPRAEARLGKSFFQFRNMGTGEDLKNCVDSVVVIPHR